MFGVAYYPEHWPRRRWKSDALLMKRAGFKVVRLAEFAWEKIEPDDGVFDFSWLDDVVELLGAEGIDVVLGTPTAAPPAWLVEKHPNILPVRRDGTRMSFGGRHHNCHSNDIFRESVEIIVRSMAVHYRDNPHVKGWQVDNELGNSHEELCYCDSCRYHFHAWLQRKYGTIDALNAAWGTVFWSQTYTHFTQIPMPLATPNSHNPALLLDWHRFTSDLIVDFQRIQVAIIRDECREHFVTHNFMGFAGKVDYHLLCGDLDFVSHDQYPLGFEGESGAVRPAAESAMPLDFIRGLKSTRFWIMEQQSGAAGWETIGPTPRPGQIRLWTAQSIAHGADAVLFFRWRTSPSGTEQYWHGILPHSGDPGARYEEVAKTVRELDPVLESLKGGDIRKSRVAILFSYDQLWAFDIQPHHPDLRYLDHIGRYYSEFHRRNIAVDFVGLSDELAAYDLVFAPMVFLVNDELVAKLRAYVENGGVLLATMRSGVKDWNNGVLSEMLPGPFGRVFGIQIPDYDCLRGVTQGVRYEGIEETVSLWADIIETAGAAPVAVYAKDYYADRPAITEHAWEAGTAYYVGTELGDAVRRRLVARVLESAGIENGYDTPDGVEAVVRSSDRGEVLFLLNHTDQAQIVPFPDAWRPALLPDDAAPGESEEDLVLPAFEIALFTRGG